MNTPIARDFVVFMETGQLRICGQNRLSMSRHFDFRDDRNEPFGRIGYDEMFAQLEIAIHQFAKRQMTWFRGMERRGLHIHWIDAMRPVAEKVDEIIRMM